MGEKYEKLDLDLRGASVSNRLHPNEQEIHLTKKYYAFGQLSRYIRPGYCILNTEATVCWLPTAKKSRNW